jgi:hypothetical protein
MIEKQNVKSGIVACSRLWEGRLIKFIMPSFVETSNFENSENMRRAYGLKNKKLK